jgi:hypothetical protein
MSQILKPQADIHLSDFIISMHQKRESYFQSRYDMKTIKIFFDWRIWDQFIDWMIVAELMITTNRYISFIFIENNQ